MIHQADDFKNWANENSAEINGKWVVARPLSYFDWTRIKAAWLVLIGRADAIVFKGQ